MNGFRVFKQCKCPLTGTASNHLCPESLLTKDDDLDDLCRNANNVLDFKCVVPCVVDGGLTDDKTGVFSIAFYLDAVEAVLQFDTAEVPGADRLWSGLYGNVEVNGFSPVHVDNLLRDVGHVNFGHLWNEQKRFYIDIIPVI